MSSFKAGVAAVNVMTPAQIAAAKAALAHQLHMQALGHTAATNIAGVTGAHTGVGAAGGVAGSHAGLSVASAVITPIAIGAAALLVTYAAGRLAGAAVDGLADLADSTRFDLDRPISTDEADELWMAAVTEVTRRNARISALRGSMGPAGPGPDLPLPCTIGGSTVERMVVWCRTVDEELGRLDAALAVERRRRALDRLRASQPAELVAAAALIDVRASGDARAEQVNRDVDAEIMAAMREMPGEAADHHHADALRISARARAAAATGRERAWLIELREKVRQAKRAVEDANLAAVYLVALDPQDSGDEPLGPDTLLERLRAVRDGRALLGDDLRAWAAQALADAETARLRAHVLQNAREALTEQGFDVDTTSSGAIRGAHTQWRGWCVELDVDDRLQLSATLRTVHGVRESDPARVAEWQRFVAPMEGVLSQAGITVSLEPAEDASIMFAGEHSATVAEEPEAEATRGGKHHEVPR